LYRDDQGRIGLPTAHLIHRLNTVIQNQTRFADHFMIHEPFITLLDPDTDQPVGWSTFEAPGRIVDGVQRWILRAKVDRWKCTVLVATEDDRATSLLRKIFVRVGKKRRLGCNQLEIKHSVLSVLHRSKKPSFLRSLLTPLRNAY